MPLFLSVQLLAPTIMKTYTNLLTIAAKTLSFSLFLALSVSCQKDVDPIQEDRNIMQILAVNENFSSFQEMIFRANLGDELSADGPFTVFAPTNAAFNNYLTERGMTRQQLMESPALRDLVLYHILSGALLTHQIPVGQMETLSPNNVISFEIEDNAILINRNTNILTPDVQAVNGVIHGINRVLEAPEDTTVTNTVVDIAARDENLSIFSAAIEAAGLEETFGTSEVTVFAPTNEAFERFVAENNMTLGALLGNEPLISSILLNHTLAGTVASAELETGFRDNALGRQIHFSVGESIFINGRAQVTEDNILADNGLVHLVDQLVRPANRNLSEYVPDQEDLSQLWAAIFRLGLVEELRTGGPFTLFAPTDVAFQALYAALGVEGLDDIDDATLRSIINYHLVAGYHFSTDFTDDLVLTSIQGETIDINVSDGTVGNVGLSDRLNNVATNGVVHITDGVLLPPSMR